MFKDNKYTRWYMGIIQRAQNRTIQGYGENHHIIPEGIGGPNTKENKARLTAREHFICHRLLVKMVKTKDHLFSMSHALWFFLGNGHNRPVSDLKITSRVYEEMRKLKSIAMSHPHAPEVIAKRAASNTGKKRTAEQKQNLLVGQEKYYTTANHEELVARAKKSHVTRKQNGSAKGGRPKGIPMSEEQKEHQRQMMKGKPSGVTIRASCKYCKKETTLGALKQFHRKCAC